MPGDGDELFDDELFSFEKPILTLRDAESKFVAPEPW